MPRTTWVMRARCSLTGMLSARGAAVLPFGATEPHNLHMPYGTDTFQVEELGRRATSRAWEAGARVLLLPALPYGVNTNYFQVPGALACSLTPTTLLAVLTDLVD